MRPRDDERQLFAQLRSPRLISRRRREVRVVTLVLFFFLFSDIPRYPRIQSPEGSTLSICGDSQLEEISLDEGRSSLPATSRDDSSELSFYRHFVEGHAARVTCIRRSCEILRRRIPSNTAVSSEAQRERSVSDCKLKKLTYRPYTIEEYRSLSVPRPDRSLGPDKDEVQVKVCFCNKVTII